MLGHASTNSLGLDSSLNLLSFGDFLSSRSDVQGRVAAGGNVNISNYSINDFALSGNGLTVGGDLTFFHGNIYGNTVVGGSLFTDQSATVHGSVQGSQPSVALGLNFAAEKQRLTSLSQGLEALASPGHGSDVSGWFVLDANHSNLAVFDVTSGDVMKNLRLDNLNADTTVIINVQGQTIDFGSHDYRNFAAGHVLFNFAEATQITFASGVEASFLAPLANFTSTTAGGWINGQVIVNSWSGGVHGVQVNAGTFTGVTPVPEPETYALMLAGLCVVTCFSRRRHKTTLHVSCGVT